MLEITVKIFAGRFTGNGFEYPVEIGDAVKTAGVGHRSDIVIISIRQFFAGFVDPYLVEEGDESMQRMFFKEAAERMGRHVHLTGGVFEGYGMFIVVHDVIVDVADADAVMVADGDLFVDRCQRANIRASGQEPQQLHKMHQLLGAVAVGDAEHLRGDVRRLQGGDFKAALLLLYEVFQRFHFRQVEQCGQVAVGVKEDDQRHDLFAASRREVGRIAFEDMRLVGPQPENIAGPESMHIIIRHEGALSLLYPGELHFLMPVQVRIKIGQHISLYDDGFVEGHRYGKL